MERRNFLKGTLGTLYMMATPNMALPDTKITEKRLLIVLLRGGMDGLASIPPIGDKNLSKIRKDVLVNGADDLDGFFGINPSLKFLGLNIIKVEPHLFMQLLFPIRADRILMDKISWKQVASRLTP